MKNLEIRLGYPEGTKLLMIHADDAGLCHSENLATLESMLHGSVNSCSVMVPCPWFNEMAGMLMAHPNLDYGVHLTLTCEWKNYKFGPVLPADEVPSLVDENGFFHAKRAVFLEKADPVHVRKELRAQIRRALSFGMKPSHLDSHMYTLGTSREFLELYIEIGREFKLPVFLNRELVLDVCGLDIDEAIVDEAYRVPHIYLGNFGLFQQGKLTEFYQRSLENLKPGLNIILIHPAYDDREMQAIAIDHPNFGSQWRQIDLDFFTSETCRNLIEKEGARLINWTDLKAVL